MMTVAHEQLIAARQVYRQLGISESKFYRMLRAGLFPAGRRLGPGATRWRQSDVDRWIADNFSA